eukprot:106436-Hanusia_phi.AAC.1
MVKVDGQAQVPGRRDSVGDLALPSCPVAPAVLYAQTAPPSGDSRLAGGSTPQTGRRSGRRIRDGSGYGEMCEGTQQRRGDLKEHAFGDSGR